MNDKVTLPSHPSEQTSIVLEIRLNQIVTDADSRDAYDRIYTNDDITQTDSFYLWLMQLFDLQSNDSYLDVSCGQGQLVDLAKQPGVQVHGLDIAFAALYAGRIKSPYLSLTNGNGQQLPYPDNSFTVISNIGSLEHYVDMSTAVAEMSRVLKPDGRAFILVPNTFSLMHNIWAAFRKGSTHIDIQPIQRYMARKEWQQLLENNGLAVKKTLKYEIERPRTRADWGRVLRHPKRFVRLLIAPFVPLNLAFCFVFCCTKAS